MLPTFFPSPQCCGAGGRGSAWQAPASAGLGAAGLNQSHGAPLRPRLHDVPAPACFTLRWLLKPLKQPQGGHHPVTTQEARCLACWCGVNHWLSAAAAAVPKPSPGTSLTANLHGAGGRGTWLNFAILPHGWWQAQQKPGVGSRNLR